MHISGKILTGFVLLLGAVAIWLSSKTLGVRQSYMEQAQKNKQEFLQREQQLADALVERDRKRTEFVRAIAGWERVYEGDNVKAGIDPSGIIVIDGVGTSNGVKVGDVLYLFALGQEAGSSIYVGSLQVAEAKSMPPTRRFPPVCESWCQPGSRTNSRHSINGCCCWNRVLRMRARTQAS